MNPSVASENCINAGPGTDRACDSPGDGLLEHNRAYLDWIKNIFERHPELIIENCSSGGLRMDYAQLAIHSIQSVSDQTDFRLNAIIAAACASAVTPEQAAIWSYPLKEADEEETIFNMVTVLLLRIHQSGCLHEISSAALQLVKEGIAVYKRIRADIPRGIPFWPLGLPRFGDGWGSFWARLRSQRVSGGVAVRRRTTQRRHNVAHRDKQADLQRHLPRGAVSQLRVV